MISSWLTFQGKAADVFAELMARLPGSTFVQLCVCSAILGVILIFLYRYVSFQDKLAALKQRIMTIALEPFLFSDSARISLISPLKLILLAGQYMLISVPPVLILGGPVIWLMGLWNQVVGYMPPAPHEQVVVTIQTDSPKELRQLETSVNGIGYDDTQLVRSYRDSEAVLGLNRLDSNDGSSLLVKIGTGNVSLPLLSPFTRAVPVLTSSFWSRWLYPGSDVQLPSGLKEIAIGYPSRSFGIFGFHLPWEVVFLVISMASGLIFAKIFKIQI